MYKMWYLMVSTTVVRFKYYHAWLLADAICNNSGLGFNGYEKDGNPKWDLITNINVISFEVSHALFFIEQITICIQELRFITLHFSQLRSWQRIYVTQLTIGIWARINGCVWLSMNEFRANTAPH